MSYWGLSLIRTVCQILRHDYVFIEAGRIDDMRTGWAERNNKSVLFYATTPEQAICGLYADSRAPSILFLDEPVTVVRQVKAVRGMTSIDALRFATECFSTLQSIAILENTWVFSWEDAESGLLPFIGNLTTFFGFECRQDDLATIATAVLPAGVDLRDQSVARSIAHLTGHDSIVAIPEPPEMESADALIRGTIVQFGAIRRKQALASISLPAELFFQKLFTNDDMPTYWNGPLTLTGAARHLVFGPYIHLPSGRWKATITIEIQGNYSGNTIQADIYSGAILVQVMTELPAYGIYQFDMAFTITEPRVPIEIRILLMQGAIEGAILFRPVELVMQGTTDARLTSSG